MRINRKSMIVVNFTTTDLSEQSGVKVSHNLRKLQNLKTCQIMEIISLFWQRRVIWVTSDINSQWWQAHNRISQHRSEPQFSPNACINILTCLCLRSCPSHYEYMLGCLLTHIHGSHCDKTLHKFYLWCSWQDLKGSAEDYAWVMFVGKRERERETLRWKTNF